MSLNEITEIGNLISTDLNRHVERDRYDSVQNDSIGEEHQHSNDGGTLDVLWHHDFLPRQIRLEIVSYETLPNSCGDGAKATNRQQKENNLQRLKVNKSVKELEHEMKTHSDDDKV